MKKLCMILPLALILCFMVGCQDKETMVELEAMKAQVKVEEQNKASFRYMMEETDKGNYSAWDEVCSADYVSHWGEISWNLEEHKKANRALPVAFPDFEHELNSIIAKGDMLILMQQLGMELKPKEGEK